VGILAPASSLQSGSRSPRMTPYGSFNQRRPRSDLPCLRLRIKNTKSRSAATSHGQIVHATPACGELSIQLS
jgi:hypothetical protein